MPKNADMILLHAFVAEHCRLNPNAAQPLNPDSAIVAERDKARGMVADLRDQLKEATQARVEAERTLRDALAQLKVAQSERAKSDRKAARQGNATPVQPKEVKGKPGRNAYMRDLMRRKRAEKKAAPQPAAEVAA